MASVRRALLFSLGQRYIAFALQLVSSVILARLLTPHETGIFSLAAAAVAIGQLLREFGTAEYVITETDLTRAKLRAAYGVNFVFALGVAAALLLLAAPLAAWYQEPGLRSVLALLALNFVLLPFGSVGFAVLSKELAFDRIFVVQTTAAVTGAVVTVAAALAGQSYLSPAIGSLASIAVTVVLLGCIAPAHVFMWPSWLGARAVLRFGGPLTVARFVDQAAARSTDFIVSAMLGFAATGFMSKANSLLSGFNEFFSSAFARVATPALARSASSLPDLRDAYVHATVMISLALGLFFMLLGIFGSELILLLFGPAWLPAVAFVHIGAVGSLMFAPYMLANSLLTARRAVHWQLWIQVATAPVWVLMICIGAQHSIEAVAAFSLFASALRLALTGLALRSTCGLSLRMILRPLGPTAAICAGAALAAAAVKLGLAAWGGGPLLRLAGGVILSLGVAVLIAHRLQHPALRELRAVARSLRPFPR
jgi:O-antigen/teichoic acid export membrane protein